MGMFDYVRERVEEELRVCEERGGCYVRGGGEEWSDV